jgi:hypothetical protein
MFGLLEHLERPAENRPLASSEGPVAVRNDGTSEDDRRNDGRSEAVARNVVTIADGWLGRLARTTANKSFTHEGP